MYSAMTVKGNLHCWQVVISITLPINLPTGPILNREGF